MSVSAGPEAILSAERWAQIEQQLAADAAGRNPKP
jgi:hypothetical protein